MSDVDELEVRTSLVELINFTRGGISIAVRVDWRPRGRRRWEHFILLPDVDQTIDELRELAGEAARRVYAGQVRELRDDQSSVRALEGEAS